MDNFIGILVAILAINVIVFVHESGHYLVGRATGLLIEEFAIGMGPKIFSWKRNEIVYSLRILPLGGFTRFFGEDQDNPDPRALNRQKPWKRALTLFAGSAFNIMFAIVLAVVTLLVFGNRVDTYPARLAQVQPNAPAQIAGLQAEDEIVAVNGLPVADMFDVQDIIGDASKPVEITYKRAGVENTVTVVPQFDAELNRYLIGVTFPHEIQREYFGFFGTVGRSFGYVYQILKENLIAIYNIIFRFQGAENVGSVVMVVDVLRMAAISSFEWLLHITLAISAGLGLMNLLPFPALDGSRLVFVAIEAIRRKPVNPKTEGMIHLVGMAVLLGLFVLLAYKDIVKLFGG